MKYLKSRKVDYFFALLVFALAVFGIVMISSASVAISYEKFGRNDVYLFRQIIAFFIGIIIWLVFQSTDYHFFRKIAPYLLIFTFFLLILVFIPKIGVAWRGVHRWISLGPFAFQPAEIAKLSLILYLASWLEKMGDKIKSLKQAFLPFTFLILVLSLFLIRQPDIGTLIVILGISAAIFFTAGGSVKHLICGFVVGLLTLFALIKAAPYRMARFVAYFNPEKDPLGIAYHVRNALIAIGSGGLLGLGFGESRQKHLFLPEAHTDSIFAIICEELGFIRAILVILAFVYLAFRGYKIAKKAPDTFGRLVTVGIITWFVFQAFINIAGIISLLPFTGVPLPFISYGGTSLVISFAAVGILLNISKHS